MINRLPRALAGSFVAVVTAPAVVSGAPCGDPPCIVASAGSLASLTGSASPYGLAQARGASLAAVHSRPGRVRVRLTLADDQSSERMGINQMIAFTGARVAEAYLLA